ncbi:hypothetical protein E4U43_000888 [Claviceps pusilla]|uniref:Uncharacterized protein n=1 Tax=Claviceps pusilla TaxID=123648 RepID=A0A9P7N8N0_9HYPO|nr:hypothetical protein E4U43_000888 [Claviceps pusilla]
MVINRQPYFYPRPVGLPESEYQIADWRNPKSTKKIVGPSRTIFVKKSRYSSDGPLRRPLISAPSDFRHVQSGSYQLEIKTSSSSQPLPRPVISDPDVFAGRKNTSRPSELSIYLPDHQRMSPFLPQFEFPKIATPTPPSAYCAERSAQVHHLSRQRTYSSRSFQIPPPGQLDASPSTTQGNDNTPPRIPAKSKYRGRARTASEVDTIRARVESALIEVEYLQKQIDNVIERQSLYITSPPSTSHSTAQTTPWNLFLALGLFAVSLTFDIVSMPSSPAQPPAAPSFTERLNADANRPPPLTLKGPEPTSYQKSVDQNERRRKHCFPPSCHDAALLRPLPLVPRPPLRKKKSFSAVSTWLFSDQELTKKAHFEPITNEPKSVKGKDGFYQIVSGPPGRRSFESFDSISTWHTEDEDQTSPTTCSPGGKSM